MLSNYRSARDQGKRDAALEAPEPMPGEFESSFDPLGAWQFGGFEESASIDEDRR